MRLEVIDNHRSRFVPLASGWHQRKMRFAVKCYQTKKNEDENPTVLSLTKTGLKVKTDLSFGKSTENYIGHQVVERGQFVFTPRDFDATPILCGVAGTRGCISNLYIVFDVSPQIDAKFLEYFFWGLKYGFEFFEKLSFGMRYSFNRTQFENIPLLHPDLATQRQIADFLDRETARIDLLIEKKQRLVALLGEREKVLVEETLRLVDASNFYRLKFAILQIEQGWSPQCEDATVKGGKWGVLKLGAITTGVYLEEQHKALPESIKPCPSLRVQVGDVLVARASGSPKLVGKAAFVETSTLNLMISDKHFRLVPNTTKVLPEYLATVVNSGYARSQIEERLSSAEGMARNIGQNVIYGMRCPFPSLEAQEQTLNAFRALGTKTNATVSRTIASIDRLKEYRSALITAAVTGQIDVGSYTKSGVSERQLEAIQEEMGA